jgi:L-lactate dehydrogenase complex protein LldE
LSKPRVGLFVTCLVDLFRPSVGFAAVRLLEAAGCTVEVPTAQTCCGQPAYNAGDFPDAKAIARRTIDAFAGFDYVVAPSGSCAGMLRKHFPTLLADDSAFASKAQELSLRTWELISFLVSVRGLEKPLAAITGRIAYHDSCSGLRELGVREQPRKLLRAMTGVEICEPENRDACCGFGGTFAVKYDQISGEIARKKCAALAATGARLVLGGDLGCLLHLAGRFKRDGLNVSCRHVAEVLAGPPEAPPIGGGER